jgi:gamma-glutamyl hydrolase
MVSITYIWFLFSIISYGFCTLNNRPIIGILTQPTSGILAQYGSSYIAASYVKYLEGGGSRVVPIFHNATFSQLDDIFDSINGILFPGGGSDIDSTQLFFAGKYLYYKAITSFDNNDYFPILGHCMGFELLATITSQDFNILSPVDAENISMPLNLTKRVANSRWLGSAPSNIINILTTQKVTLNNHRWGVTPAGFKENAYLPGFYNVLSTNNDQNGVEFISLWEAIKYPIYGAQWHAEKVQYEWNPSEDINHSPDAVLAMQYFAEFFVNEARKSQHQFPSTLDETKSLIYNYNPYYTENIEPDFEQVYVF